jgi:sugar O-acyltransferase (sialic acid O-acetyltransferase NeuD family)
MKNIVIYGAQGMGREVLWLIENINVQSPTWNVLGFLTDEEFQQLWGRELNGCMVLGGMDWLINHTDEIHVICALGKGTTRQAIYEKVTRLPYVRLATLVDPSVRVDPTVKIGVGSIICCNCIVTVNINLGKGVLMNTGSSIGHDALVGDYCTFHTKSMASGNTVFGEYCEIGSGAFVLQKKKVVANTVIAPLSSILTDINKPGVYAGNPARRMR